ncbi:MAG: spore maturation protein A [Ruminococcaceae bacterium]|nr:spore maturation protein A [Oscillospiraceae bacterium]
MNYVWSGLMIISVVFAIINGRVEETMAACLNGAKDSVTVLMSFAGIMCFWSGILQICERCGASQKCERLLSPIIRRLFPHTSAKPEITMNVISNLFGLGNAATPSGIAAMEKMDKENCEDSHPSHEMSRFAVMNTASLQIIPTTVIGILASFGSKNPYSIIPLIWISSSVSLFVALILETVLYRLEGRKKK